MSLLIAGIGTAVPEHEIEQLDAADRAADCCPGTEQQQRVLTTIYRRAGVRTRRSVLLEASTNGQPARQSFYQPSALTEHGPTTAERMQQYEIHAAPLAIRAGRNALAEAGLKAGQITHLITVSCSGFASPGWDLALQRELGLPPEVARAHLGFMGCHGAFNALRVAQAFCDADPSARVLLCAVELCSLHHQYSWDPDQVVANSLFADGAAAIVGRRDNDRAPWRVTALGSFIVSGTEELMSWRIGNQGFQMTLSPSVPAVIESSLRPWLSCWLEVQGLEIPQVRSWAVHPGGPRILDACAAAAGLARNDLSDSREVLAQLGNMSSPTVLFILKRLKQRDAPRPCVALAFGPGLSIEAALIR